MATQTQSDTYALVSSPTPTCSTVIAAAPYYGGVELDKTRGSSHIDLVTPKQIVTSKGRFFTVPNGEANSGL
jgi:hypothetical protein